jgi:hypothetical protein
MIIVRCISVVIVACISVVIMTCISVVLSSMTAVPMIRFVRRRSIQGKSNDPKDSTYYRKCDCQLFCF